LGRAGDFLETQKEIMSIFEAEREQILEHQNGFIILSDNFSHAGWALFNLGYPEQSEQRLATLLELARSTNHPFMLSESCICAAFSSWDRRQVQKTKKFALETISISRQHGYSFDLGGGLGLLGWALGQEGKLDEGINKIRQGLALVKECNSWLFYQHLLPLLADTYLKAGMAEEGLTVVDESLALIKESAFRVLEPEIYRLKGELLLLEKGNEPEAEGCFQRAIESAKAQKAKSWELRATMSLCRLWQKQGKGEQAKKLLSEIYGWFTEGFGYPDLQDAQALLESSK
jgi:tetratricopeptide (TPR) repeat protein